jgi:hypothetical protein
VATLQDKKEPFDYITKWQKERSFYTKAIIDPKTGDTWPYFPLTEEKAYENWKRDVVDPQTNAYYRGHKTSYEPAADGSGSEIQKTVDLEPYEVVRQITRERTEEGKEYLLSKGIIVAFNEFGAERRHSWSNREKYNETLFRFDTEKSDSTGKLEQQCKGPEGSQVHYLMPFNDQNVDKLWQLRDSKRCVLVVKDAVSQEAKECPTLDMFKTKTFDYIKNMDYLSEKEKEDKLKEFEAMQGIEKSPTKGKK